MSAQWTRRAACAGSDEPDLWFPVGEKGPALLQAAEAQAACRRCPVIEICLAWALDNHIHEGVWGGATEEERKSIRRRAARDKARPDLAECGTQAAYQRHTSRHEPICDPCRKANTKARQEQAKRRELRGAVA